MNIVQVDAEAIVADGKPVLGPCLLCGTPKVARARLGRSGTTGCAKCLRAALVELIEAMPGASMKITTDIDGVELTTRVNVDPHEDRDE